MYLVICVQNTDHLEFYPCSRCISLWNCAFAGTIHRESFFGYRFRKGDSFGSKCSTAMQWSPVVKAAIKLSHAATSIPLVAIRTSRRGMMNFDGWIQVRYFLPINVWFLIAMEVSLMRKSRGYVLAKNYSVVNQSINRSITGWTVTYSE